MSRINCRTAIERANSSCISSGTLPITQLRLGSSDASTDPSNYTTHQAYTALAHGFGPGFNGPLELVYTIEEASGTEIDFDSIDIEDFQTLDTIRKAFFA